MIGHNTLENVMKGQEQMDGVLIKVIVFEALQYWLFIQMTGRIDVKQLIQGLTTTNIISPYSVAQIKKLNGLHVYAGPWFVHA